MTNLNVKYLAIIVDDFSIRSLSYDNVVVYDYADYYVTTSENQYFQNDNPFSLQYLSRLDYEDYETTNTTLLDSFYTNVDLLHLDYLL